MRVLLIFAISFLFFQCNAFAQRVPVPSNPEEEQNEVMIDTLKKMRIKREEDEHKKLVGKGTTIHDLSESLVKEYAPPLSREQQRAFDQKLKEIEKAAKSIRTDSGGFDSATIESPPKTRADALKQLLETSQRLNDDLAKTNRRVVSVTVLKDTNEIIELVKLLRSKMQ